MLQRQIPTSRAVSDDRAVTSPLETIATRLGSSLRSSSVIGTGTLTESHRIVLLDGRAFAAQRRSGRSAARRTALEVALRPRLAAAGVPVPSPATVVQVGRQSWLVTPWVDGESGREWLGDEERSRGLAVAMGAMTARLATVDATDLGLDQGWASADALGRRAAAWLRRLGGSLGTTEIRQIRDATDTLRSTFAEARRVLAHGDFAPVNVIVGPDGAIRALIDWEAARLSVPLLDVAWWGWIVRFHHPDMWSATWPAFLEAAGVPEVPSTTTGIATLQVLRCLELAASAPDATGRADWLERLAKSLRW